MTQPTFNADDPLTFEKVWAALMETRERQKETDRIIGKLGNRFGELVENLITPNIEEKFNELGFDFSHTSKDYKIRMPGNPVIFAEIDIMLENGQTAIAVEVKAKPNDDDVRDHLERMDILRSVANHKNDSRKYRGALAGGIISESVCNYALKSGLYVIEPSGETVRINVPEDFIPR